MDVTVERVAGIDIGKADVVVAVRVPGPGSRRAQEVRTYAAFTSGLAAMADWLIANEVMESTGQYWKPVWHVLAARGLGSWSTTPWSSATRRTRRCWFLPSVGSSAASPR